MALLDLDHHRKQTRVLQAREEILALDLAPVHGPISYHLIHSVLALVKGRLLGLAAMRPAPVHMNVEDLAIEMAIRIRAIYPADGTQLINSFATSIFISDCNVYRVHPLNLPIRTVDFVVDL